MATKATTKSATKGPAKASTSSAVTAPKQAAMANWQDELAQEAERAAEQEANVGGGSFFSTRAGTLSWQDNPLPDNQMAVIIIDGIMENTYYDVDFDPQNPRSPICYAFGRDDKTIAPHAKVFEQGTQQSDTCETCDWNKWASAEKGRGKACKNGRRLALIGAGQFGKSGEFIPVEDLDVEGSPVGFMRLPVMSVKGYASYVKQLAGALKRPPFAVYTKVKLVSDPQSQFRVTFEALSPVPDELMPAVMARHKMVREEIGFPYQGNEEKEEAAAPAKATGRVGSTARRAAPASAPAATKRKY